MIDIIDDFLSPEDNQYVWFYCLNSSYTYGAVDAPDKNPTGMMCQVPESERFYKIFAEATQKIVPDLRLVRIYINCFAPTENPWFHVDSMYENAKTFIYYPACSDDIDNCGTTQFYIDDYIHGVIPKTNRMIYFDSSITHRATSFRDGHRFTVAVKYESLD